MSNVNFCNQYPVKVKKFNQEKKDFLIQLKEKMMVELDKEHLIVGNE
jgi:hypothetical protein